MSRKILSSKYEETRHAVPSSVKVDKIKLDLTGLGRMNMCWNSISESKLRVEGVSYPT
jgi:hypothetical protein